MEKESDNTVKKTSPPPLPLGWTQVQRAKRPRDVDNSTNPADEIDWCCDDPNCKRSTRDTVTVAKASENSTTVRGTAIFCIPEIDPEWFQGYLQIEGQRKPWGLLATQETLDECLECKDGGYRQITLQVFPFGNNASKEKSLKVGGIEWTGGDMMRLQSAEVSMETHSLWTGTKTVPYVEKYFGSLAKKLCGDDSLLEVLPELAIVTGPMTLSLAAPVNDSIESNTEGNG
jgi:hypothetical protein